MQDPQFVIKSFKQKKALEQTLRVLGESKRNQIRVPHNPKPILFSKVTFVTS